MTTDIESLDAAIQAHEQWKTRLYGAIATGKFDGDPRDVRRNDACAFGKWLKGLVSAGPRRIRVAELHDRFHLAAAQVLTVALAGKKREALELLADKGEYAGISARLMREMAEWKQELR